MQRRRSRTARTGFLVGVAIALIASATAIGARTVPSAEGIDSLNHADCYDIGSVKRFVGWKHTPSGSNNATGMQSNIAPPFADFVNCSTFSGNDSVSAWVALAPAPQNPNGNVNAIVQVGIIRCNNPFHAVCTNNAPHYFWADGGCNGDTPTPENAGSAASGNHNYKVTKRDADTLGLYIDGALEESIDYSNAHVSCWYKEGQLFTETGDSGDIGGRSTNKISYDHAKYYNANWFDFPSMCGIGGPANPHHPFDCSAGWTGTTGTWFLTWSQ